MKQQQIQPTRARTPIQPLDLRSPSGKPVAL